MLSLVLGVGGLMAATAADARQPMTATTWVNLRTGPSTSNGVIRVLSPQEDVVATGKSSGGWREVTTDDDLRGWVYGTYLRADRPTGSRDAKASRSTTDGRTAQVTTTANVNVRSGPSTGHTIIDVARKGTRLSTTGATEGSWTQVIYQGTPRWIHQDFLTTSATTSAAPVTSAGKIRTTANLYLRTGGSLDHRYTGVLPGNSVVDTTGRTTSDYTEIQHQGETRWIATRYTRPVSNEPAKPAAPTATGTVYVSVGTLNVRATSTADGKVVATVHRGDALKTTGKTTSTRTQVIHRGTARWVYSAYVSRTKPSSTRSISAPPASTSGKTLKGISKLNGNGKKVVDHVLTNYPKITNIYGWRSSSSYSSDHPNGRAVDIMIPKYKSSSTMVDYGWTIAKDFQANAKAYNVSYIIYRQKLWNAAYPDRGWRTMENRGSDTANHMDHVHVSVKR